MNITLSTAIFQFIMQMYLPNHLGVEQVGFAPQYYKTRDLYPGQYQALVHAPEVLVDTHEYLP